MKYLKTLHRSVPQDGLSCRVLDICGGAKKIFFQNAPKIFQN
jgi:hypothetical protein